MSNKALLLTKLITTFIQLLILLLALIDMMNGIVSCCTHRVDVTIIRDHFWDGVSKTINTRSCVISKITLKSYFILVHRKWSLFDQYYRRTDDANKQDQEDGFVLQQKERHQVPTMILLHLYRKKLPRNI